MRGPIFLLFLFQSFLAVNAASFEIVSEKAIKLPVLAVLTNPIFPTTPSAEKILSVLFKALGIQIDASKCVKDNVGAGNGLRTFATDLAGKRYEDAVVSLANGVSALSSTINDCQIPAVQAKFDTFAAALHIANVTLGLDKTVKILVGASQLEKDIEQLSSMIAQGDSTSIADTLQKLMDDFTTIVGGCGNSQPCRVIEGILKVVVSVEGNLQACESAFEPAYMNMSSAVKAFRSKNYTVAITELAYGLDSLGVALSSSSCNVKVLGNFISELAPKLKTAVVKDGQILVGFADVYDELFKATEALSNGDVVGFGIQMGRLLQSLKASGCESKACVVFQGLLGALQLEAGAFDKCYATLDKAWGDFESFVDKIQNGQAGSSVTYFAKGFSQFASAVSDCDIKNLGTILENTAATLGGSHLATQIGSVISIVVEGADITTQFDMLYSDFTARKWQAVGQDMMGLSKHLTSDRCQNVVCHVVEGLLSAVGVALTDLKPCEKDLKDAGDNFILGSQFFSQKKLGEGIEAWGAGLNLISRSVKDCGVEEELQYIQQESTILGFGNASVIGTISSIIVHGADVYEDLYDALMELESHDWRGAGRKLGSVMNQLSQWTQGHACTTPVCYMTVGVLTFLGGIEGSIKQCENDLKAVWSNFTSAVGHFRDSHHSVFKFIHNSEQINDGVRDLGQGFTSLATAVGDCHLQAFADLLAKLALKLGISPEIAWFEEILHIVIEGVNIEREVGAACDAYGNKNWVKFGYKLAQLINTLL